MSAKIENFKRKEVATQFGQNLLVIQATKKASKISVIAKNKSGRIVSKKIIIDSIK